MGTPASVRPESNGRRPGVLADSVALALALLLSVAPYVHRLGFYSDDWAFFGAYANVGSQTVEGRKDSDVFPVGKRAGRFDQITVVVTDSDLEMISFVVTFENNKKFDPKMKQFFKEGTRTRVIDLPEKNRAIKEITVKYANLPGGGKAKVEIYARDTKGKGPT